MWPPSLSLIISLRHVLITILGLAWLEAGVWTPGLEGYGTIMSEPYAGVVENQTLDTSLSISTICPCSRDSSRRRCSQLGRIDGFALRGLARGQQGGRLHPFRLSGRAEIPTSKDEWRGYCIISLALLTRADPSIQDNPRPPRRVFHQSAALVPTGVVSHEGLLRRSSRKRGRAIALRPTTPGTTRLWYSQVLLHEKNKAAGNGNPPGTCSCMKAGCVGAADADLLARIPPNPPNPPDATSAPRRHQYFIRPLALGDRYTRRAFPRSPRRAQSGGSGGLSRGATEAAENQRRRPHAPSWSTHWGDSSSARGPMGWPALSCPGTSHGVIRDSHRQMSEPVARSDRRRAGCSATASSLALFPPDLEESELCPGALPLTRKMTTVLGWAAYLANHSHPSPSAEILHWMMGNADLRRRTRITDTKCRFPSDANTDKAGGSELRGREQRGVRRKKHHEAHHEIARGRLVCLSDITLRNRSPARHGPPGPVDSDRRAGCFFKLSFCINGVGVSAGGASPDYYGRPLPPYGMELSRAIRKKKLGPRIRYYRLCIVRFNGYIREQ